ncbi:MAG: 4-alpha-glucanotransferase [Anaerolineales bacterium]|nr:4-alpha-glucanotransferase [Anaerolineales bacterium]
MRFKRAGGILLHPTSLFGDFGIGDIGPSAHQFIDLLGEVGCGLWQVLPLGPTGYGNSPYQSFSSFAGNPYLISPKSLLEDGLLTRDDLDDHPTFPAERVDYGKVIPWKQKLLRKAFDRYKKSYNKALIIEFEQFIHQQDSWLPEFSLYMAIKNNHDSVAWVDWPTPLRDRDTGSLEQARVSYEDEMNQEVFNQFIFHRQWADLRARCANQKIQIIGDIPIFVAHDSAEVWSNPELFFLDKSGNPTVVAGVPPDYFSETGQLWGNPLYRWDIHRSYNYSWWIKRIESVLNFVDIVRIDHFRGFAGYWEIPYGSPTAEKGRWVPAPGEDFFKKVLGSLGELPVIAEDLGVITPDVVALRQKFDLPGMIVLQFAYYGNPTEAFLPHNHVENRAVYTGTHDNDTTSGWFEKISEEEKHFWRRYMGRDGNDVAWDMIRAAWSSVSVFALAPLQDFLSLDSNARMNLPGDTSGHWEWRMKEKSLNEELKQNLADFNFLYNRSTLFSKEEEPQGNPYSPGSTV